MDTTAILEEFRRIAKEYDSMSDDAVNGLIIVYADMVGKKVFGKYYARAVACLVAHFLKLADMIDSGDTGSLLGGEVKMEKEGDLQRQYGEDSQQGGSDYEALLKRLSTESCSCLSGLCALCR